MLDKGNCLGGKEAEAEEAKHKVVAQRGNAEGSGPACRPGKHTGAPRADGIAGTRGRSHRGEGSPGRHSGLALSGEGLGGGDSVWEPKGQPRAPMPIFLTLPRGQHLSVSCHPLQRVPWA